MLKRVRFLYRIWLKEAAPSFQIVLFLRVNIKLAILKINGDPFQQAELFNAFAYGLSSLVIYEIPS